MNEPMSELAKRGFPTLADFPAGAQFVIFEHDRPLVHIPVHGWISWDGGTPSWFDVRVLRIDNNRPADSFDEWIELVRASKVRTSR